MKRIVIACDGSDGSREALEQGVELARTTGAVATLVYVRHAPFSSSAIRSTTER